MTTTAEQINPDYRKVNYSEIKGTRSVNTITFNPNRANPGEEVYVNIPKLRPNVCIVPDSMFLLAKFKNTNTKSWFLNNLGRLLVRKLQITVGGEVAYDNTDESQYEIYKDLWLTKKTRGNMVCDGIMNENTRKLMSGDDSGDGSVAKDAMINNIFKGHVRIKLGKILNGHGLFPSYGMVSDFRYKITLPASDEVLIPQSSQVIGKYSLEDIQLEYETIEDSNTYHNALSSYDIGRTLTFEHVTAFKRDLWLKTETLINENINLPRKSMKALVLLFRRKTVVDSERFEFPMIEKVKITIEGVPNYVYSQGMTPPDFFYEAEGLFLDKNVRTLQAQDYYAGKMFALVVDLRSFNDNNIAGIGKKIINTQSGILLEITKKGNSSQTDVYCTIYVVSDGLVTMANKSLESISY